jgi:hypothetical protein
MEDKLLLPFELALPSWLKYYADHVLDLEDTFLIRHAHLYPYISARLINDTYNAAELPPEAVQPTDALS